MSGVAVDWYDAEKTILVHTFNFDWAVDDYYDSINKGRTLMMSAPHTVHAVMDFTYTHNNYGNPMQMARYAEMQAPPNIGERFLVHPSFVTRQLIPLLHRLNFNIVKQVHIVDTLEDVATYVHKLKRENQHS